MKRILFYVILGLGLLPRDAQAQGCTYTVSPVMQFGSITSLPTPQIDVTATISVTCTALISADRRVCLSIPAGSGGVSIADRRMVNGSQFVQYQLYRNSGRTNVWGALGNTSPPVTVDFPLLIGTRTISVTVYGRVIAGQTGKAAGIYQSNLTPQARWQDWLLIAPSCQNITSNPSTLSTMTSQFTINPACTITANPLTFGTVTRITGHPATSNLSVTCTQGGAYSIALNGGSVTSNVNARRMRLGSGPNTIDYQLYRNSARTLVWGNTSGNLVTGTGTGSGQSIPVYGAVPAQGPKPPGVYRDTITATITF